MADAPTILSGGDQVHLAPNPDHMEVVQNAPSWKASVSATGEYVRAQVIIDPQPASAIDPFSDVLFVLVVISALYHR